jgi:two-component sensor histidine kinase
MIRRVGIILLCCILQYITASAIPDTARFQHFDLDNGFPSNNVYSVIQDKFGYLWFATDNGVVKYNGYSIRVFNTADGLPSNDVYQLYEDDSGRIWLHSASYQFGYIEKDKYRNISLQTRDKVMRAWGTTGSGSFLFFDFLDGGINYLAIVKDKDLLSIVPIYRMYMKYSAYKQDRLFYYDVFIGGNCKMYATGSDGWFYVYDLLRPFVKPRKLCRIDFQKYPLARANSTQVNKKGLIFFFEYKSDHLYLLNSNICRDTSLVFNSNGDEYIYTVIPNDRHKKNGKGLTIITNAGIYETGDNFNIISSRSQDDILPVHSQIAYVFKDAAKNIWYTTTSKGAWYRPHQYATLDPVPALADIVGTKYYGNNTRGDTYWWDKSTSVLYIVSKDGRQQKIAIPHKENLRSVTPSGDTVLYLTMSSSIFVYDLKRQLLSDIISGYKSIYVERYGYRENVVDDRDMVLPNLGEHLDLMLYGKKKIFSVNPNGFYVFDIYKDSLEIKALSEEHYEHLAFDSVDNRIIAYNKKKMLVYDPGNGRSLTIGRQYLDKVGLDNIINIEIDKVGNIFIEDNNKILVYNSSRLQYKYVSTRFDLSNASMHIFGEHVLIAGDFGLATADIKGPLSVGKFKVVPNVANSYYNRLYNFSVDSHGAVLLNTDKGFYKMSMKDLTKGAMLLDINTPEFVKIVMSNPFQEPIVDNDTIFLDQGIEKISLDAINYYAKGNWSLKYSIRDLPHGSYQTDGDIYVGGLTPGRYYSVNCSVSDDIWESTPRTFYVYRFPYWWQTRKWIIAFTLSGIMVVLALILFIVFVTRRVIARSSEKKRALTELELKAVYAQINPHFIFNTLNAAQYFISKRKFDEAYAHVSKFSRLLRAYLKSSQDRYITLDSEIQMLKNYIELQQIRFEEKFEYRIEVDNKLPVHNLLIPSLLLQPLVENAINHGLFHRSGGGLLVIKFLLGGTNDELVCVIEDNGVGRYRAREINAGDSTKRESYGTKLTRQLIDIYREYEQVDIKLEYIDKGGDETGTIVKLTVKKVKYIT